MIKNINVALIGNPNTGKTSVFNALTGLNQKVGNYPGITVEKKQGSCRLDRVTKARILDLPGTYSLNASSMDESVVVELLLNKNDPDFPDVARGGYRCRKPQTQPAVVHTNQRFANPYGIGDQYVRSDAKKRHQN